MLLPHPAQTPEERLKLLDELREGGVISQAEYELHRAEIEDEALPAEKWTVHPPL